MSDSRVVTLWRIVESTRFLSDGESMEQCTAALFELADLALNLDARMQEIIAKAGGTT